MRVILELSISEIENVMAEISVVEDVKPCPAIPSTPVATSMNYLSPID